MSRSHCHDRRRQVHCQPFRPKFEILEERLVPAVVNWVNDGDGFWDVGSNWDTGAVPTANDDVVIDRPAGNFTVTFRQSAATVRSVTSAEQLAIGDPGGNPETLSVTEVLDA